MDEPIHVHLTTGGDTQRIGALFLTRTRGRVAAATYLYRTKYVAEPTAFPIDPQLPLGTGPITLPRLPGVFADCLPGRWGSRLLTRKVEDKARRLGSRPEPVGERELLLGASDVDRQGALRFSLRTDGPFLDTRARVPQLAQMPDLLRAVDMADRGGGVTDAALGLLLGAGAGMLGGSRPKASVRDKGRLFVAKFPRQDDAWDVVRWEYAVMRLARQAGVVVPRASLHPVGDRPVLLIERFDRRPDPKASKLGESGRIPYMSAMTALERQEDDLGDYLDLVETIQEISASPVEDSHELWRRICFSVLVNNTDDHLLNHGFLRGVNGWTLSPQFDVNPDPRLDAPRTTSLAGAVSREDVMDALMEWAPSFSLTGRHARGIRDQVFGAMARWPQVASGAGLNTTEQEKFAESFAWRP